VLAEMLELAGHEVVAHIVPVADVAAAPDLRAPTLADGDALMLRPTECWLVNGLGSIGPNSSRRADLFADYQRRGYSFMSVVHPAAVVSRDATLGEGSVVMAGAIVQVGATIAENCIINTRASVDHDCIVAADVHIAPGATLSGSVRVGARSHIGAGVTVVQGVAITNDVIVGAGSVVLRDLSRPGTYVGIPARFIAPASSDV
jgi:sugar O-acyltransferase (sialic acid O-acetyltransferase NeuD family)